MAGNGRQLCVCVCVQCMICCAVHKDRQMNWTIFGRFEIIFVILIELNGLRKKKIFLQKIEIAV